jgi:hypothetical protein
VALDWNRNLPRQKEGELLYNVIALLRSTKTPCLRKIEKYLLCFSMLGSHDDDNCSFFLSTVKKTTF